MAADGTRWPGPVGRDVRLGHSGPKRELLLGQAGRLPQSAYNVALRHISDDISVQRSGRPVGQGERCRRYTTP